MVKNKKGDKCKIDGCNRLVAISYKKNGITYWRGFCELHRRKNDRHRIRRKRARTGIWKSIERQCILCGWLGRCDKHRILSGKDGGKYNLDNIEFLCPNCHRARHGFGEYNKTQQT